MFFAYHAKAGIQHVAGQSSTQTQHRATSYQAIAAIRKSKESNKIFPISNCTRYRPQPITVNCIVRQVFRRWLHPDIHIKEKCD
jgi:hypothetical protein